MIISKFAQFEFKFGDPERGRTMFESLLSSYPKRVDLWSVYIDMMTKTGKVDIVRLAITQEPLNSENFGTPKLQVFSTKKSNIFIDRN